MSGKLLFWMVTALILSSCSAELFKRNWKTELHARELIDIDSREDGTELDRGSGTGIDNTDDEDLYEGSTDIDDDTVEISGSGDSGITDETTTTSQSTRTFTQCEQLRNSIHDKEYARHMKTFVPRCTLEGSYEKLQCRGEPGIDECWCVFPDGNKVVGTDMHGPRTPDCQFGSNLKKCIHLLLKNSWGNLGTYRPRCTIDGDFEKIQCFEGDCWCVDMIGLERIDTRVSAPNQPMCEDTTEKPTTPAIEVTDAPVAVTTKKPKVEPGYDVHSESPGIIIDPGFGVTPTTKKETTTKHKQFVINTDKESEETDDVTEINESEQDVKKQPQESFGTTLVSKPFLMGALIAGAVVGLLGAILLVMFIVYRMRKKDEGSYALEEQKFTNYSYMKAPEKEFYA